jgi:uncharacterized protein
MTAERKSTLILSGIATLEGAWVLLNAWRNPAGFITFLGFAPGRAGNPLGWLLAFFVVALFVGAALRLPSVRSTMFQLSSLKLLALAVAISAGILEKVVFRKLLMDYLGGFAALLQVLASGFAFGLVHGVWGLFGRSIQAALGASVATGLLGVGLGAVYITAGRSLAPCVVAHLLINALIEPGLVLAAARGEMGRKNV